MIVIWSEIIGDHDPISPTLFTYLIPNIGGSTFFKAYFLLRIASKISSFKIMGFFLPSILEQDLDLGFFNSCFHGKNLKKNCTTIYWILLIQTTLEPINKGHRILPKKKHNKKLLRLPKYSPYLNKDAGGGGGGGGGGFSGFHSRSCLSFLFSAHILWSFILVSESSFTTISL